MALVVGSTTFQSVRGNLGPSGELHAVRDETITQDRGRGKALCGLTVVTFEDVSWPPAQLLGSDDYECPFCRAILDTLGGP